MTNYTHRATWVCGLCGSSAYSDYHGFWTQVLDFGKKHLCNPSPRALRSAPVFVNGRRLAGHR